MIDCEDMCGDEIIVVNFTLITIVWDITYIPVHTVYTWTIHKVCNQSLQYTQTFQPDVPTEPLSYPRLPSKKLYHVFGWLLVEEVHIWDRKDVPRHQKVIIFLILKFINNNSCRENQGNHSREEVLDMWS